MGAIYPRDETDPVASPAVTAEATARAAADLLKQDAATASTDTEREAAVAALRLTARDILQFTGYITNQGPASFAVLHDNLVVHPNNNLSNLGLFQLDPADWQVPAGKKAQLRLHAIGGHSNVAPSANAAGRLSFNSAAVNTGVAFGGLTIGQSHILTNLQTLAASASYEWDTGWTDAPALSKGLYSVVFVLSVAGLGVNSICSFSGALRLRVVNA